MVVNVVEGVLAAFGIYVTIGAIVAVPFLIFGISRMDPGARGAPVLFRLLVLPGVVALWPLMLRRWVRPEKAS